MYEASSKTIPRSVLWGEIQVNCNPSDAINLWKPIEEYRNIAIKHDINIDEQEELSSSSSAVEPEEEKEYYDPVGSHLIELRNYYQCLEKHFRARREVEELACAQQHASERTRKRKYKRKNFNLSIPKFPEPYPFSQSLEAVSEDKKRLIKYDDEFSECQIKRKRIFFIKSVLAQTGFYVKDSFNEDDVQVLECLSYVLDDFLQKFVKLFWHNKNLPPFSEDEDLWHPLEITLRKSGVGGITALHLFYYENVVKKHDMLLERCVDLYTEFEDFEMTVADRLYMTNSYCSKT